MKKLLITTACTLAVTIGGTYATDLSQLNYDTNTQQQWKYTTNTARSTKTSEEETSTAEAQAVTSTDSSISNYANEVLELINEERANQGLSALTTTASLASAANQRAVEIEQLFSHTRPDGTSCFTVLDEYGVSYMAAGENIAYGQSTPQDVVDGWMNSEGHRANILNSDFNQVGIGVYQSSDGTIYWTQLFTN